MLTIGKALKAAKQLWGLMLFMIMLIIFELYLISHYIKEEITRDDIIKFKGEVSYFLETTTNGSRRKPIIKFRIKGAYVIFKIQGDVYTSMEILEVRKALQLGNKIEVGTIQREMDEWMNKSGINSLLNKVINNRKEIQVYHLVNQTKELFDLDWYNQLDQKRRLDNLIYGSLVSLTLLFFMITYTKSILNKKNEHTV